MNRPGQLTFNRQANTIRDERGFVADANGMPPHYRALFLASPKMLNVIEALSQRPFTIEVAGAERNLSDVAREILADLKRDL